MSYGELTLPPVWTGHNLKNGRFLKGHVPANKGKKWSEFLSKRSQRRCAKGWKNLELHRPKTRPDNAGRCRRQVICVSDDGRWKVFPYIGAAEQWLHSQGLQGSRHNIGRCCRENEKMRVRKHDWGKGQKKGSGYINTDHRYCGFRWYFEDGTMWLDKIKK